MNDFYHIWFSAKQKEVRFQKGMPVVFCSINGIIQEHTTMNSSKNHNTFFDDMVYLGYGTFHEGRINTK